MTGEEFVLAVIAMVAGSVVLIVGIATISSLIKSWIRRSDKGHFSDEEFHRLAKAFMQHKKDMEQRVANLEAIAAGDTEEETTASTYPQIEEPKEEKILSNDLEEKRRVR